METIAALDIRSEEEGALANVYANQRDSHGGCSGIPGKIYVKAPSRMGGRF